MASKLIALLDTFLEGENSVIRRKETHTLALMGVVFIFEKERVGYNGIEIESCTVNVSSKFEKKCSSRDDFIVKVRLSAVTVKCVPGGSSCPRRGIDERDMKAMRLVWLRVIYGSADFDD